MRNANLHLYDVKYAFHVINHNNKISLPNLWFELITNCWYEDFGVCDNIYNDNVVS